MTVCLSLCATSDLDSSLSTDKARFLETLRAHDVQATLATSSGRKLVERRRHDVCDKTVLTQQTKLKVSFTWRDESRGFSVANQKTSLLWQKADKDSFPWTQIRTLAHKSGFECVQHSLWIAMTWQKQSSSTSFEPVPSRERGQMSTWGKVETYWNYRRSCSVGSRASWEREKQINKNQY